MGSSIPLDEIKRFEVTEVYSHPNAKVDIVFVHGLNGDPRQTWTSKEKGTFWPSQLLPVSLKSAQARILVYGYNADVYTFGSGKGGPSSDMIHQHAQTMLKNLASERTSEDVEEHPIIFVAHSLGGILVKRALELSHDLQGKSDDGLRSIYVSTYGVIFLGTPHNGADAAKWGLILQGMVDALIPRRIMSSHSQLIKTLQSNNETLQNTNLKFLDIYRSLKVCMVHETNPTDLKGAKMLIVDQLSAGPLLPDVEYFGIEATHSGMCKFDSKNSPGYTNISVTLKQWVQEAPGTVEHNWVEERILRQRQREGEAAKILRIPLNSPGTPRPTTPARNTTDSSSLVNNNNHTLTAIKPTISTAPEISEQETYFIKPNGFRPNSLFVGRESELVDMHRMLFDKKRRAEGTSAVLIQSLPGGGKTHLAREYVYRYKDDFPGGIFWLRAKSETELAAGYWEVACKAALKNTCDDDLDTSNSQAHEKFIQAVRIWFEKRHEWLLVLDGIHFSHSLMRKFIPDSKNTSLIYTSTEKSVIGDHHFMNPQIMKLPLLSAREAQRLLLLELGRREPFNTDDMRYSMELVQSMGFLPVVIHAVAQRLKSTDEPLSKYAKSYSSEPRLRGLGTYNAVVEQLKDLGAHEALNLIHIICFFSQHIPVEMISRGLRAIDVPVKTRESVTGQSLNNTFKILNTFALIDRNEHDLPHMHSSQSSKDSRDMIAENIDVIRLHSVVQGYFVDTLHAEGTLPVWLDRAVRVFCCSYDYAHQRIAKKSNSGRVEDYRLYEIHGKKLQEHLTKYNSRHVVLDLNIRPAIARRTSKHLTQEQKILIVHAQGDLLRCLSSISDEIERRTPDASEVITGGKLEFQNSIFDRTSSSSDTGPETPGSHEKVNSNVSTWGLEPDKGQLDSPESLTHDYLRRLESTFNPHDHFPIPMPEDPGYDTDNEESAAMTVQPSQRTMRAEPDSPGWEQVRPRRSRTRAEELPLHRTIKNLEKTRYRDSAGAFRAMISADPRAMKDTYLDVTNAVDTSVEGVFNPPRQFSRGRLSSQSSAEAALSNISQSSPPPVRGGGMIQDRRSSSSRPGPSGRMIAGSPSYAQAVTNANPDTVGSYKESSRLSVEQFPEMVGSPHGSAVESLHRFPIVTMPPYPPSPERFPERPEYLATYSQDKLSLGPTAYPSTIYPALEGLPPVEVIEASVPPSIRRDNYSQTFSGAMPPAMRTAYSSAASSIINPDILSFSSPDIQLHRDTDTPYYPGHPEFSNQEGGYTSQPMSRDPSGQSAQTTHSVNENAKPRPRKASLSVTEPIPRPPHYPSIPPTSYQVFQKMRERDLLREEMRDELEQEWKEGNISGTRKSPRLELARIALRERLEGNEGSSNQTGPFQPPPQPPTQQQQQQKRPLNPTAAFFSPTPVTNNTNTNSPPLPTAPLNSMLSSISSLPPQQATPPYPTVPAFPTQKQTQPHPQTSNTNSPYSLTSSFGPPRPQPHNTPASLPSFSHSQTSPRVLSNTNPNTTPKSAASASPPLPHTSPNNKPQSENMERTTSSGSGSGGFLINNQNSGKGRGMLIEFGDFPELVDLDVARERARVLRGEGEKRERERAVGLGLDLGDDLGFGE